MMLHINTNNHLCIQIKHINDDTMNNLVKIIVYVCFVPLLIVDTNFHSKCWLQRSVKPKLRNRLFDFLYVHNSLQKSVYFKLMIYVLVIYLIAHFVFFYVFFLPYYKYVLNVILVVLDVFLTFFLFVIVDAVHNEYVCCVCSFVNIIPRDIASSILGFGLNFRADLSFTTAVCRTNCGCSSKLSGIGISKLWI